MCGYIDYGWNLESSHHSLKSIPPTTVLKLVPGTTSSIATKGPHDFRLSIGHNARLEPRGAEDGKSFKVGGLESGMPNALKIKALTKR